MVRLISMVGTVNQEGWEETGVSEENDELKIMSH